MPVHRSQDALIVQVASAGGGPIAFRPTASLAGYLGGGPVAAAEMCCSPCFPGWFLALSDWIAATRLAFLDVAIWWAFFTVAAVFAVSPEAPPTVESPGLGRIVGHHPEKCLSDIKRCVVFLFALTGCTSTASARCRQMGGGFWQQAGSAQLGPDPGGAAGAVHLLAIGPLLRAALAIASVARRAILIGLVRVRVRERLGAVSCAPPGSFYAMAVDGGPTVQGRRPVPVARRCIQS